MSSLKRLSALVIDDNRQMRVLLRSVLTVFGVGQIREAGDVSAAMTIVNKGGIDLVFVDYRLASEDGATFCKKVRNDPDPDIHYLPLIMVTGYAERARILEAINVGVDEYLVKPVRAKDMASRINAVIERRRPFFRTLDYFGPDRRRRADPKFNGPYRRFDDEGDLAI